MSSKTISCVLGAAGFAASAALLAANVAPAQAGGLPEDEGSLKDTGYAAPAPAPVWTGFYAGIHGGYAWGEVDFPGAPSHPVGPPRPELEGGFVGGQIGYNYQFNKVVLGIVGDLSFGNFEKTVRDGNYLNETAKIDRFGSVRGILGYSMGRFLPYATVGYGWASLTYSANCPSAASVVGSPPVSGCGDPGPRSYSDDVTMDGVVFGGGLKYAINEHFSVGAEYLHFESNDETYINGPLADWPATSQKIKATLDTAKFTVDYKF